MTTNPTSVSQINPDPAKEEIDAKTAFQNIQGINPQSFTKKKQIKF